MTDFWQVQLRAREVSEQTGLSMREIAELPADEYGRLLYGKTPAQAAHEALREANQPPAAAPQTVSATPSVAEVPEPDGIDISNMTIEQYAALRQQIGLDRAGRDEGIFGSVSSKSQEFTDAVARHAGGTAYGRETHASIEMRFPVDQDRTDRRSLSERFGSTSARPFQR